MLITFYKVAKAKGLGILWFRFFHGIILLIQSVRTNFVSIWRTFSATHSEQAPMCFASVSFSKNGFSLLFNKLLLEKRNEMDGKILWLAECCALRPRMGKSQEVPWRAAPVLLESPSQCGLQRVARRPPLCSR